MLPKLSRPYLPVLLVVQMHWPFLNVLRHSQTCTGGASWNYLAKQMRTAQFYSAMLKYSMKVNAIFIPGQRQNFQLFSQRAFKI